MIMGQKLVVILPAYNAEKTLAKTYAEIPMDIVDEVVLVDDHSTDRTAEVGRALGIRHVLVHPQNRGYGGNQKTCLRNAKIVPRMRQRFNKRLERVLSRISSLSLLF